MANELLPLLPLVPLATVQLQMCQVTTIAVGKGPGGDWLLSSREESAYYGNSTGGQLGRGKNNGFEAIIQFWAVTKAWF